MSPAIPSVDFCTNCWEQDYREVLSPGFVHDRAAQCLYSFRSIIVTVNNVKDEADARLRAAQAVERGDMDRVVFVADALPRALRVCKLTAAELGKVFYYTNFLLVTLTCTDAKYIVHFGSEISQERAFDWVTPALQKLQSDRRYLIANPAWVSDPDGAQREAHAVEAPYFVGYGFSDHCFLVERARLAADIYHYKHPASARYPLSDLGDTFEKRIDAYMRCSNYLRLTDPRARWIHHGVSGQHYAQTAAWPVPHPTRRGK